MDYKRLYDDLISSAFDRNIEGSFEKHHIIPKSLGGSNDPGNIIKLSPREHFVAHRLLTKIYPESLAMSRAVLFMIRHKDYRITSRVYESLKKENVRLLKDNASKYPWTLSPIKNSVTAEYFKNADKIFPVYEKYKEFGHPMIKRILGLEKGCFALFRWFDNFGNPLNNGDWSEWKNVQSNSDDWSLTVRTDVIGPWFRHINRGKLGNVQIWANADIIFDYWNKNGRCGYAQLSRALLESGANIIVSEMLFRGMIRWFVEFGDPRNRSEWRSFAEEHKSVDLSNVMGVEFKTRGELIAAAQTGLTKENCEWRKIAGRKISASQRGRSKADFNYLKNTSDRLRKLSDSEITELCSLKESGLKHEEIRRIFADRGIALALPSISTIYNRNKS